MANEAVCTTVASASTSYSAIELPAVADKQYISPLSVQSNAQSWNFGPLEHQVNLRGGGCASSLLCDTTRSFDESTRHEDCEPGHSSTGRRAGAVCEEEVALKDEAGDKVEEKVTVGGCPASSVWPGWAELENDPDIFTILLQEWGVRNLHVQEITDLADLIIARHDQTLGLILLSRYVAAETSSTDAGTTTKLSYESISQPWFANQISKFSCGTVALMNILMNSQNISLSETLSAFKSFTGDFSAKDRGIALDENAKFREIHNSFSTKMDRMIVDVLLKEDAQKFKNRKAAEARQAKQAEQQKGKSGSHKRKRGVGAIKRKKKQSVVDEEEDNGFHFVAYLPANEAVWKMDGLQAQPGYLGKIDVDQTWLNVAAEDLMLKMEDAFRSGQDCSLMSVSKTELLTSADAEGERLRKQEDWAPFIEHMLRLHAEKGDLQDLLDL